jgi:hypothetical protein
MTNAFRSPRSIALTVVAVALIAIGIGALLVRPTFASPFGFGPGYGVGGPWHTGPVPAELRGLADIPDAERFSHFRGVQVQLTDKDNKPLRVDVVPGTVSSVSGTSLTVAGNDGTSRTYTLDSNTMRRGDTVQQNDQVVVATLNGSNTATAVFSVKDKGGFGPRGPWNH